MGMSVKVVYDRSINGRVVSGQTKYRYLKKYNNIFGNRVGEVRWDKASGQTFYSNYSMMRVGVKAGAPRSRT